MLIVEFPSASVLVTVRLPSCFTTFFLVFLTKFFLVFTFLSTLPSLSTSTLDLTLVLVLTEPALIVLHLGVVKV